MKKFVIFLCIVLITNLIYAEEKKGTVNSIDEKIKEKLQKIEKADIKNKVFEKEVKKEDIKRTEVIEEKKLPEENQMLNLSILNITAGIFEGAIIGSGYGLIGYSQLKNKNTVPLINGAIIGTVTGVVLASSLSLFENFSKKYTASEDFGLNLIYYSFIGGLLGCAGGVISYGKTSDTENISEGIGYGIAIGSFCGLIMSFVEVFGPEQLRQRKFESQSQNRAFNIFFNNEKIYAMINL